MTQLPEILIGLVHVIFINKTFFFKKVNLQNLSGIYRKKHNCSKHSIYRENLEKKTKYVNK